MAKKSIEKEILDNRKEVNNIKKEDVIVDLVKPSIKNRFSKFTSKFDNLKIKYKKDPKKYALLLSSLVLGFSLVIGSSYAYLTYISKTDNITLINAGTLALTFKNESNSITLDDAFPMSDNEGLLFDKEYDFTIENNGDIPANYKLSLDNTCVVGKSYTIDGNSFTSDKCVPNEYVKVGLKAGDGEYKVLEGPSQSGQKGEAEVVGAVKDSEGMVFDGTDDYINLGYANYDFDNKITVAARFKTDALKSANGLALIDNFQVDGGFEFYVDNTGKIVFQFATDAESSYANHRVSSTTVPELGEWVTAVATYDGTTMKMYINGVLDGTFELTDFIAPSTQPIFVGASPNPDGNHYFYYDGAISDVLVMNDVLSSDEISANYSDGLNHEITDETLFYQKWNETKDYVLDSGVLNANQNLTYKMKIWLDYDTPNEYNSQGTLNVIYSGKLGLSYEQAINLDKSGANSPTLSSAMVPVYYDEQNDVWRKADEYNSDRNYQWYDYDKKMWANAVTYDHTIVDDLSSSNNNGQLINTTYSDDGVNFNGTNSYISIVSDTTNYDFGNKITIAARFKVNDISSAYDKILSNTESGGFSVTVSSGKIQLMFYSANEKIYKYMYSSDLENNTWYTAVVTYNGSEIVLYVNGKEDSRMSFTENLKASPAPLLIGGEPGSDGSVTGSYFDGIMSDILVINDALSEQEIEGNYSHEFNYQENDNTLFYYNLKGYEGRANGTEIPMDMINTMLVWVPRYKYNVWNYNLDGTVTSDPQEIQITFEKGTNSTGDITCTDNVQGTSNGTASGTEPTTSEICKINDTECTDDTCNNKTYTHPAFTFGDKELTGIWVGKFEVSSDTTCTIANDSAIGSGCNLATIKPIVKPNVTSWRGAMVSVFENNMMVMNDTDNIYGFDTSDDTHVIKNIEWGAVAYLSHSKYGINKEVAINSTTTYKTGCGPQSEGSVDSGETCNSYNTSLGKGASTTGNIYGIYDMSGGTHEYVIGNILSPDGVQMMSGNQENTSYPNQHSGYDGILYYNGTTEAGYGIYDGAYSYPNNKYIDKYSFNTSEITRSRGKLGDGIREVLNTSSSGWHGDLSELANGELSWFSRGGYNKNGSSAGIFYTNNIDGSANTYSSSRLVISQ